MIFKKKTEVEVTLTEEELEVERLKQKVEWYKRRYESLVSDHNQQKVNDSQFLREEQQIAEEVEQDLNKYGFDEQMGEPLKWMEELFNVER